MKVIIIDDEKGMLLIMKGMLAKIPDVEIVGAFQNTADAFKFMESNSVDLAFIDISMPEETGLEFAKRLFGSGNNAELVFVTSYKEYALEAFDVYAFDYIVKPVSLERLERTIKRALNKKRPGIIKQSDETNEIKVFCLGGIDVKCVKSGMVKWQSAKSLELFAYLLINRGRRVSRAKIIKEVFEGMPQDNAEKYLNTTIYKLRKSLEPHELKGWVVSDSESYWLELNNTVIDFVEFEEGLKNFSQVDNSNIEKALEYEKTYTGNLFGETGYLWAVGERQRLWELYTGFVKSMSNFLIGYNTSASIRLLKKILNRDMLDDEANRLLLVAYAAQGDKYSLSRHYERYVRLLNKELGTSPSYELINLYADLRAKLT